ncbi:MAG: hypothetical protein AAFP15_20150, partial [Bacteroidota bacterium]
MFYGQPTPMSWPGAASKPGVGAGSDSAAAPSQIVFGDATGYDKSYPDAVLASSGKPQAGGAMDASSPYDVYGDFKDSDFGGKDFRSE